MNKKGGISQHFSQHDVEFLTDIFLGHFSRRHRPEVSLKVD